MLPTRALCWRRLRAFAIVGLLASSVAVLSDDAPKRPGAAAAPPKREAAATTPGPVDLSRYPYRVPDWLWQDQRRSAVVDAATRSAIEADLLALAPLLTLGDSSAADKKKAEIAKRVANALALRDLTAGAEVCFHASERFRLAVQIDPSFDERNRKTLIEAARLFLSAAVDDQVVKAAMADSIVDPSPRPEMFRSDGIEPVTDSYGNKVYTEKYQRYLTYLQKPTDAEAFKTHLRGVLSRSDGAAAVLCISRYTGGDKNGRPFMWWGTTYMDFYNDPVQQLGRLAPSQGFLYISLNSDRMKPGEPNADDPVFWASKIGHESLHALGYDHPGYKDADDRDKNNPPGKRAFIVAYEFALLSHLVKGEKK